MVVTYWIFQRASPGRVDRVFRGAQLASSALLSHAHGANDAQKTMGIMVGLLVSVKPLMAQQTGILHHLYMESDHYGSQLTIVVLGFSLGVAMITFPILMALILHPH